VNRESAPQFTIHGLTPSLLAAALLLAPGGVAGQEPVNVLPVGVRYTPDTDPARRQRDLEEMRRLRFNVIAMPADPAVPGVEMAVIDRLLAGAVNARFRVDSIAGVALTDGASTAAVTHAAWSRLAAGGRRIIFDDWTTLQTNTDALTAAAAFADHVARNAALYAPLRPREPKDGPADVTISGGDGDVTSHLLESDEALVVVVTNSNAARSREVTMQFSPALPEAIWQNMLTGASVNFVAGPNGPAYTYTIEPHGVLVLMIRKRFR